MADNTIIQQGYFTSDGTDAIISLRSDVDWIEVYNLTNIEGSTQWAGCTWKWYRGMKDDDAFTEFHAAASQATSVSTCSTGYNGATYRGITLFDSSDKTPGAAIAVTAGTDEVQPVYSTADTGKLVDGSIVRLSLTAQVDINGMDFTVDTVNTDTNFRLANALDNIPGIIAGANGYWRYIAPNADIYNMFHPKKRTIVAISQANPGIVTTSVDHLFETGQKVRLNIPSDCGMEQLSGQLVTVTRIDAGTFSIGVDTTGYDPFLFPEYDDAPFTHAEVIPIGEAAEYNHLIDDALENSAFIGLILGTSTDAAIALGSPGGTSGDKIYWRAGKSFSARTS